MIVNQQKLQISFSILQISRHPLIADIQIQDTQICPLDQYHCSDERYCELVLILSTVSRSTLYGLAGGGESVIKNFS
jgi:hypothetical protein